MTSQIVALDTLGCAFEHFTLSADALSGAPVERLKEISQKLSERLNYLLEPISPIETDAEGCTVQMRSSPPQKEDDATTYYELLVRRGGELSLRRYTKTAGDQRRMVPAQVTREVFLRLAGDFAGCV